MLYEHGILTTPQLVALGFASLRMTQMRLHALHTLGITDRVQPFTAATRLPLHHILGPVGARVIAAEEDIPLGQLGWRHDRALAAALAHTLPHDRATHDLVCALAATPDITLTRWWSAARCARYFGHHTRPDAYLALKPRQPAASTRPALAISHPTAAHPPAGGAAMPPWWWEAFLEYDTGTEALAVLAAKIHGYHRLAVATGITTPVLIYTARPGREPGARAALAHTVRGLGHPALVPIATATRPPREPVTGPFPHAAGRASVSAAIYDPGVGVRAAGGRMWLPLTLHPNPEDTRLPRLTLAELAAATPAQPPITGHRHRHTHPASGRQLHDPRRHATAYEAGTSPHGLPPDVARGARTDEIRHDDRGAVGVVDLPAPPPLPPRIRPASIAPPWERR